MSTGMPAGIWLQKFGTIITDYFGHVPYHVGSSLKTKDWRDVDVRLILPDDEFKALFGSHIGAIGNPKLSAITLAFSALGSQMTGLPIDFQIQPASYANKHYPDWRSALIEVRPAEPSCQDPTCPDYGDPSFGEGTCPEEHAEPLAAAPAGEPTDAKVETRTEWGVRIRWDDTTTEDMPCDNRDFAERRVVFHVDQRANNPGGWLATAELIRRTITTGPWVPVPAADGDSPAPASTCPGCGHPMTWHRDGHCAGDLMHCPCHTTPAPAEPAERLCYCPDNSESCPRCNGHEHRTQDCPAEPAGTDTGGQDCG